MYIYICTRFIAECLLSSVLRVRGQKRERSSEREGKKKEERGIEKKKEDIKGGKRKERSYWLDFI